MQEDKSSPYGREMCDLFFPTDASPAFSSSPSSNARLGSFLTFGILPARSHLYLRLPSPPTSPTTLLPPVVERRPRRIATLPHHQLLPVLPLPPISSTPVMTNPPTPPNPNLDCGAPPPPPTLIHHPMRRRCLRHYHAPPPALPPVARHRHPLGLSNTDLAPQGRSQSDMQGRRKKLGGPGRHGS
jgi:hypothetical protein